MCMQFLVLLGAVGGAIAIAAAQPQAVAAVADAHDKHVNLRVLPADISKPKLGVLMRGYRRDLGVECSYCHVQDRDSGGYDYASDENPKKEIARLMIGMLDDINDRHLAGLGGDRRYAAAVTCGSCHQGRANPPAWEPRR